MTDSKALNTAVVLALAAVGKIGPVLTRAVLNKAKTPQEILDWSLLRFVEIPGISEKLARQIKDNLDLDWGLRLVEWAEKNEFRILTIKDGEYPARLKQIYDAPSFLFIKGSLTLADEKGIAIVGSRNASEYGRSMAARVATEMARHEVTIVSGMALGIDSTAHLGALSGGGRTIAVLGSGIDVIYPPSNKGLYRDIAAGGAVISEFLPGTKPAPHNFPRRNRIISGLSQAVVVIEAGVKSGALLTADLALAQERQLFAIPGNISSKLSQGTNELIKAGAHLLTSAEDIFSILPELKKNYILPQRDIAIDLTAGEKTILGLLSEQPIQIDDLVRQCRTSVSDVTAYLLSLELRGLVKQLSGKRFIAV